MSKHLIYSPRYDIRFLGIERLHPFDSRKYSRAFALLRERLGPALERWVIAPPAPLSEQQLLQVHMPYYLRQLRKPGCVARALELPLLRFFPAFVLERAALRPMRWACAGTLLAGQLALENGFAVNFAGGYHHAKPGSGEGFCVYSDIALLIHALRRSGRLPSYSPVAYVDLDVHQGNGVCHCFLDERNVIILDAFNRWIYPADDTLARQRVNYPLPLDEGCDDAVYLDLLRTHLPRFFDMVACTKAPALVIYNAGTDILRGDPLGRLAVSERGVLERDMFVVQQARQRDLPVVMLLGGGYTQTSHVVIADSVEALLGQFAA
jgi:histone deacetylase 11